jgi:tRNA modification GTPase
MANERERRLGRSIEERHGIAGALPSAGGIGGPVEAPHVLDRPSRPPGTIVALATAAGESAVAVIRVSGPAAVDVVAPLLRSARPLREFPSHAVRRVSVVDPDSGEPLDDALCTVMRTPRSYTGEDVVELSCHGAPALLRGLLARLVAGGARLAEPGEFTRRAYLNGRLDLAQAEAVALLIGARTERAVHQAARALTADASAPLRALHERLLDCVAGLEVTLDFPDERVGLDVDDAAKTVSALRHEAERRLASARHGRVLHEGLTVSLVGAPNAGKSTLLNALVGRERAIVSPVAGTTRDVVEATIAVAGVPVRLLDTAGLGLARDAIEAEGMRRSRAAIVESDIVVLVIDGSAPVAPDMTTSIAGRPSITVLSKSDLPMHAAAADMRDAVRVSGVTGAGMEALTERLTAAVIERAALDGDEGVMVASQRQADHLAALHRALAAAEVSLASAPVEAALVDLREALHHVAAILGIDVTDSVLDRIFATFCLGK